MKRIAVIFAVVFFFLVSSQSAAASLILINKQGEIIWKVLASETAVSLTTPAKNLAITNVASYGSADDEVSLNNIEGKVSLQVGTSQALDVSNFGSDLVEIEERGDTKKIEIGLADDKFTIREAGVIATTVYPIKINPVENRLSVTTPTGQKFLNILPFEAAQVALRSKFLNRIGDKPFDLSEENQDVTYLISGERVVNLFNLVKLNIPVQTRISASTGEVVAVEQPTWLKVLGFVFS